MTTKACLKIDIWTDGRRKLPKDFDDLVALFAPHAHHVGDMVEQGYQAGEIVDDKFRGWWKIEAA